MDLIIENKTNDLFQRTLEDLKVQLKFVGTFGFGITGLWELVNDLIHSRYPSLSEEQIVLIFLTALTYFSITVVDDVKKLRALIREKGLSNALGQTIETLKDFENIAIKVAEKSGYVVSSLAELTGYVFLLIPILDSVQMLVRQEEFDIITLGIYLKSLLASVGIFYTKNLFNKLINRLKNRKGKENTDEVIKEHQENKDELRRILDKYEQSGRTISPQTIIDLAMMDPSNDYRYLDWMAYQVHSGFWIGIEMKYIGELIQDFHYNRENLTPERLLMFVDKMRERFGKGPFVWNDEEIFNQIIEDPADINNYPGYGQVENILLLANLPKVFGKKGSEGGIIEEHTTDYLQRKADRSTRQVVKDILNILKTEEILDDLYVLPDYVSGIDGDEYRNGEIEFNVTLHILENPSQDNTFVVDASIGGDFDDEIEVLLTLSPEFGSEDYYKIQVILNDYIRHEIEHIIDALEGGDIHSPEGLSPHDYYTQPHEVRAQKAGFKRRAKIEKKPLEDIIKDYIEYRQRIDKLTNDQKKDLLTHLTEQEKKIRVRTIYEDDNWKYIWPIDDYSFCQLAGDADWCKDGEKYYEGYGTSYILQDKRSDEKWKFDDREPVPGLPSHDVTIKDKDGNWLNTHRFLADKPSLHDMFQQKYSTFDLMKYGVELDPNLLEKYSKTNKFAEAVYRMIYYPNDEKEEELSEFLGDKFELDTDQRYGAFANTISFNKEGVSLYLPDDIFKWKYMNVDDDDEWYFDIGAERYWDGDHCEEMDADELQYIGYHINAENKEKLNNLVTLFGKNPDDYPWMDEGTLDEMMEELFPNIWENEYWELLDAIGCSVGRARVKQMIEEVQSDKVLEYSYEGGNEGLWKLDITYIQLLYIIGDKKINNFSELEDTEINHIEGGLHDVWYDAWDVDEEGLSDFNHGLDRIIDKSNEYIEGDVETILKNREKYEQIIKDLEFTQRYNRGEFEKTIKIDGGEKRVTIISYDPKIDKVDINITGNFPSKRHYIPLDKLSDYVVSEELELP